jgi:chromosome segregation ATPase
VAIRGHNDEQMHSRLSKELDDDLNDELEIEIVDDVEEDDKPRVSEKDYTGPEIPEDDEIESYSERVQKRMKKLSFEAKEAERQRQALARERESFSGSSQTFHSENEKLRQQLQQNEGTLVAQAKAPLRRSWLRPRLRTRKPMSLATRRR